MKWGGKIEGVCTHTQTRERAHTRTHARTHARTRSTHCALHVHIQHASIMGVRKTDMSASTLACARPRVALSVRPLLTSPCECVLARAWPTGQCTSMAPVPAPPRPSYPPPFRSTPYLPSSSAQLPRPSLTQLFFFLKERALSHAQPALFAVNGHSDPRTLGPCCRWRDVRALNVCCGAVSGAPKP